MHKITNLYKFGLESLILQENGERKNTLVALLWAYCLCFQMHNKRLQLTSFNIWVRITSFSKTTLFQRELFLTMFYTINSSLSFYANNYLLFWVIIPLVSSAFDQSIFTIPLPSSSNPTPPPLQPHSTPSDSTNRCAQFKNVNPFITSLAVIRWRAYTEREVIVTSPPECERNIARQ